MLYSLTTPGKIIQKFSGGKYSHAFIALDKDLNEMYSFARLKYYTPLVAGFIKESIMTLTLGRDESMDVKVFRIPVTSAQYAKLKQNIEYFKANSSRYKYNLFSLALYLTPFEFKIRDTYICTEFVSKCVANLGIKRKKLLKNRILPDEMVNVLKEYEYYCGSLTDYEKELNHSNDVSDFFDRENFFIMIGKTISQICILIYRKII